MSKENLCNDGKCRFIRLGMDRNHNHVNNKSTENFAITKDAKTDEWQIRPEKAIKNMKKIVILFIVVAGIAVFLIQTNLEPTLDFFNTTTLAVEIVFGTFIALVVYVYSKRMHEENNLQQQRIERIITQQEEIHKGIREDISYHMNGKLDLVIRTLTHSLKMYENYQANKDGKKENWLTAMKNSHDRCHPQMDFKLNLLELMRIYGTSPARKYWSLLGKLQLSSDFWGNDFSFEANDFSRHVEECLEDAKILKEVIEPFCPKKI